MTEEKEQSHAADSPGAESPADALLRQHFPTLYITLVSIVIALAIEGVLSRLNFLTETADGMSLAVLVLQLSHFVFTAAMFWWIAARWVTTVPWKFGFFDGLSLMVLLMMFHYVSQAIGVSFMRWMFGFGVLAFGSSFVYRFNGRRGIEHTGRSDKVSNRHLIPSAVPLIAALFLAIVYLLLDGQEPGQRGQILIVAFTFAFTIALAIADLWIWRQVSAEPGRFDEV